MTVCTHVTADDDNIMKHIVLPLDTIGIWYILVDM